MSSRVCCIKEKPYWYDRVIPTVQPYNMYFDLYSLDVAAVREETPSVWGREHNLPMLAPVISQTLTAYSNVVQAGGCIPLLLSKVALQQCFILLIQVFLLLFGPRLLYFYRTNAQSSNWNYPLIWSLGYATRIIINLISVKL